MILIVLLEVSARFFSFDIDIDHCNERKMKRLIYYVLLAAALLTVVVAVDTDEQCTADDGTCSNESIPKDEQLSIKITNHSPYRVDVYFDDNDYGAFISTLEQNESTGINSFVGHSFFVTRHGVKVCYI